MDRTPSCCSQPVAAAAAVYNYGVAGAKIGGYASSYDSRPLSTSSSSAVGVTTVVDDGQGCFCCDSDDDSVERARVAHAKRKCYKSCLRNAFVCALLVSYTFAGALIFLSIEGDVDADTVDGDDGGGGGGGGGSPVRLAGLMPAQQQNLTTALLAAAAAGEESRARTVETIWEITVNLNILYRENWTRLAAQELNRFQEDLIRRLTQQMEIESAAVSYPTGGFIADHGIDSVDSTFEWNMATSFLYCLSILTTIGYGNITPKTAIGKMVTMVYALIGIPLMLVYLSSIGGLLAWCARGIFTRSLCCCLCSKCGYCCYDEKLMEEKERRMKLKRERKEYDMQMKTFSGHALEPYYVRPGDADDGVFLRVSDRTAASAASAAAATSDSASMAAAELAAAAADSASFVPLLLVGFAFMSMYIGCGAAILHRLDGGGKSYLDCVFFCFMLLSTIGYGNSRSMDVTLTGTATVWFCSVYILSGMALTAMCFNIVHHGVSTKLKTLYRPATAQTSDGGGACCSGVIPAQQQQREDCGVGGCGGSISDLTLSSTRGTASNTAGVTASTKS
ncbi:uncharacterized protein LOC111034234 [Myzus persicae]|uniref:uncharacterized protein LOC111034234 n=1 Tax=Myzus persicae TaxID=13164 RepID=UPI000B9370CB|nr:uncharacterized protein LOC111034234 [Myzus persicae]XP_022171045.1 uncharacterized protein LOC111034234 [Myzus persicae]XP_022171046.1 uncharacterized protein LOC111034234 [Myzus persicae]